MTRRDSFCKIENKLMPGYRNQIALAESTVDVRNIYTLTIAELIRQVYDGLINIEDEDISLKPDQKAGYIFSERILSNSDFLSIWNSSDLPNLLSRFTEPAVNRHTHLKKNPAKTKAKIRM